MADRNMVLKNIVLENMVPKNSLPRPTQSMGRSIWAGLLLAGGIAARFVMHVALPFFGFDPVYFKAVWPLRNRLLLDISGGILALCRGPFQFWTGLRQRATSFKVTEFRVTEKLYLQGVTPGALSRYLLAIHASLVSYRVALMFMSAAWILTAAVAYTPALRGSWM